MQLRRFLTDHLVAVLLTGLAVAAGVWTVALVVSNAGTAASIRGGTLTLVAAAFAGYFWLRPAS